MANVSPGVYTKLFDLSSYVAGVPSTIGFLPILSEKGPDNQLIFTNNQDFFYDFGEPNIMYVGKGYGQGPYIATSYLRESSALYTIRCLPDDATFANLGITSTIVDGTASIDVTTESSLNTDNEMKMWMDNTDSCIMFYGVGRGEYYNNYQIKISQHINPEKVGVYVLDVYVRQSEDADDGSPQYEISSSYEVSFDYRVLDPSGETMWIEDVINRYSRYIKCKANMTQCFQATEAGADWSEAFVTGAATLQEGSSGSLFDVNGMVDPDTAKQILAQAYNGTLSKSKKDKWGADLYVDEVLDLDNYYFTIVLDGGYPTDVKTAGIYTLVQTRKDCIALVDNGDNVTPAEALDTRLNDHTFNTKYMALYESYSKIFDSFTGRDIWISPIYHMANVLPYTDNVAELWWAAAGFNRATIATIKELRFSPRLGDRDQFYLNQINPIVKFNVGYTVWGQLTTQKRPSALQDLNIIRLVLYIKRALEQFCKFFIFELNDGETWSQVSVGVSKFLKVIQNKRGLYSYGVDVGATDYEKKAKQFHVNIMLEPTRVVEQIHLNFYIK